MTLKNPAIFLPTINYGKTCTRPNSWWSGVPMGPPDPIFGVVEAFKLDKNPKKVSLAVGAYRDDNGKPYILPSVKGAEEKIRAKNMDKEYTTITGSTEFTDLAISLALGENSKIICNEMNATIQGIAGSGSLFVGMAFLKKFFPGEKCIYVPAPTWPNHKAIAVLAGLQPKEYKYYDPKTIGFDMKGFLENMCKLPEKSAILLHATAHNPTGIDPTKEQWCEISEVFKDKKFLTFFDLAYQGFASGNLDEDAFAVRQFARDENSFILAQSFSKNMGLYGERVGALTVVGDCQEEADKIISQLKLVVRACYSNPPIGGARIVVEILTNPELKKQWLQDVKGMADRIIGIRKSLADNLKKSGSTRSWKHITDQIGMFCYTGLTAEQVEKVVKEHSVYLLKNGRMSMAGVTSKNVEYIAQAMHAVTK